MTNCTIQTLDLKIMSRVFCRCATKTQPFIYFMGSVLKILTATGKSVNYVLYQMLLQNEMVFEVGPFSLVFYMQASLRGVPGTVNFWGWIVKFLENVRRS